MTARIGYTRALLDDDTGSDADALREAHVTRVFIEPVGTDPNNRPELARCLDTLGSGDILVVSSAARLSHTISHFISTVADLTAAGVTFRSLSEPALATDGNEDAGDVMAALESLRRHIISLRTREGLAAAAAEGRRPGRPSVMTQERIGIALELRRAGRSFSHIGRVLGVSPSAVQRALALLPTD